jgi:hypothetical protein
MAEEDMSTAAVIREMRNLFDIIFNLLVTFEKLEANISQSKSQAIGVFFYLTEL